MAVRIGHASINENGKATGGKAGDQTGKEVCIRNWYNKPWHTVIRCNDSKIREKMAQICEDVCLNNDVGYNQDNRLGLYTEASKVGYDIDKIKTPVDTDCSAFMGVCGIAAGLKVSPSIYTGNMVAAFKATGEVTLYTSSKYIGSSDYLLRGDILVGNGHTVMVLDNGAKIYGTSNFVSDVCKILGVKTAKAALSKTIDIDENTNNHHALVTPIERLLTSEGFYTGGIEADSGETPTFGAGCTKAVKAYKKSILNQSDPTGKIPAGKAMWKSMLGLA